MLAFAALTAPAVSAAGVYNFTDGAIEIEYCLNVVFLCTIFQINNRKLQAQESWSTNGASIAIGRIYVSSGKSVTSYRVGDCFVDDFGWVTFTGSGTGLKITRYTEDGVAKQCHIGADL